MCPDKEADYRLRTSRWETDGKTRFGWRAVSWMCGTGGRLCIYVLETGGEVEHGQWTRGEDDTRIGTSAGACTIYMLYEVAMPSRHGLNDMGWQSSDERMRRTKARNCGCVKSVQLCSGRASSDRSLRPTLTLVAHGPG